MKNLSVLLVALVLIAAVNTLSFAADVTTNSMTNSLTNSEVTKPAVTKPAVKSAAKHVGKKHHKHNKKVVAETPVVTK